MPRATSGNLTARPSSGKRSNGMMNSLSKAMQTKIRTQSRERLLKAMNNNLAEQQAQNSLKSRGGG